LYELGCVDDMWWVETFVSYTHYNNFKLKTNKTRTSFLYYSWKPIHHKLISTLYEYNKKMKPDRRDIELNYFIVFNLY